MPFIATERRLLPTNVVANKRCIPQCLISVEETESFQGSNVHDLARTSLLKKLLRAVPTGIAAIVKR